LATDLSLDHDFSRCMQSPEVRRVVNSDVRSVRADNHKTVAVLERQAPENDRIDDGERDRRRRDGGRQDQ
jgi:hypothetical protein